MIASPDRSIRTRRSPASRRGAEKKSIAGGADGRFMRDPSTWSGESTARRGAGPERAPSGGSSLRGGGLYGASASPGRGSSPGALSLEQAVVSAPRTHAIAGGFDLASKPARR